MSLVDTLLDIGEGIVSEFVPYGDSLINIVKRVTGKDDIKGDITGKELGDILKSVDTESQVKIIESYNGVMMNESDNYRKMQETFANTERFGKSKRGEVVKILTWFSCIWVSVILGIIAYVAGKTQTYPEAWLIAAILTLPFTVIGSYFGIKSGEIKSIVNVGGMPKTGGLLMAAKTFLK